MLGCSETELDSDSIDQLWLPIPEPTMSSEIHENYLRSLLEFPPEILEKVLAFVPPVDLLASCSRVNRLIHSTIGSSAELQHLIALYVSGMEDVSASHIPVKHRLLQLLHREDAWINLQQRWTRTVECPFPGGGLYDLSGGVIFLGDLTDRKHLYFLQLPSTETEEVSWTKFRPDDPSFIVDFGLSGNDELIALVTLATTPDYESTGVLDLELALYQYTTSKDHPLALTPRIPLYQITLGSRPSISMEIVGENLVLVMQHLAPLQDRLYVFNWKTGERKLSYTTDGPTWCGLILLTPEYFLLPNTKSGTFDIWQIPPNAASAPTQRFFAISLPELAAGWSYSHISCRCEPNPSGGSDGGFTIDSRRTSRIPAASAMMLVHIHVLGGPEDAPVMHRFTLFLHRSSIVNLISKHVEESKSKEHGLSDPLPWSDWGPAVSLLMPAAVMLHWITTACGQRFASLFPYSEAPKLSRLFIFDFNPVVIRLLKSQPHANAGVQTTGSVISLEYFKEPVRSELPFAFYACSTPMPFDDLMMDQEWVIGIQNRRGIGESIKAIDILHFG